MTATQFGSIHEINQFGRVLIKFNVPVGIPANYLMESQNNRQLQATKSEDIASTWIVGQRKTLTNNTDSLWINNSILKIREKSYPVIELTL